MIPAEIDDPKLELHLRRLLSEGAKLVGYVVLHRNRLLSLEPKWYARRLRRKPPAPSLVAGTWTLTDHLCRECLGRILSSVEPDTYGLLRCSTCGTETSDSIETLCACGARLDPSVDVGFRCVRNPEPSHQIPNEIVVQKGAPIATFMQANLPPRTWIAMGTGKNSARNGKN